ncbi:MAG: hypothetical protein H6R45_534 [Proteobacteria bacterium]|nr:hypothetical protein [Pseudomonadota bacterium]
MHAHDTGDPSVSERLAVNDSVDPAVLRFLLDPRRLGVGADSVTMIESHMSLVFLAGDRAYKMKKPIAFDHVDFRSLDARRTNCEREIELNRVLSPEIYLGLERITRERDGSLHLGGPGETIEWLVVMRRLDEARLLDHAIVQGSATRKDIDSLVGVLGPFYAKPLDCPASPAEVLARYQTAFGLDARSLRRPEFGLPQGLVEDVLGELARFLDDCSELIVARIDAGWIRDCHGDLRPQHVFLGPPLCLIDRLEFDENLRKCDPFEEVVDLGLECERIGAAWIQPMLLDGLEACLGSRPDERLLAFYAGMRAGLRARFAIEHIGSGRGSPAEWRERATASLELARKYAILQS